MLRPLDRGIQCTPNFDRRERSYRGIYVNDGLGWRAFPFGVLSGSAGLGQRSIFRPFVCVGVRRYGWEMPGYRSEAIPDHFVARRHVGMVGICQAVTAWHFATIIKLETARKRSRFAGLQRRGISRPFFSGMAYKNGRDLPGCRTEANHDRFWVRWHRLCRLRGARRLQTSGACGGARRLRDARRLRGPIRRLQSARPGFLRRYSSRSNSSFASRGRPE